MALPVNRSDQTPGPRPPTSSNQTTPSMSSHNDDFLLEGKPLDETFKLVIQILCVVIICVGVLGNDLLLVILFRRRQEKKFRNIFIGNLAVADLTILCVSMPYFVLDLLLNQQPVIDGTHCRLNGLVVCVCYTVSVLSLLMISFHRYIKVCHRSLVPGLLAVLKRPSSCLALWLLALILNVPLLTPLVPGYGYDPNSHMCNARAGRTYPHYGSVATILMLLIPLVLIAFFNLSIYCHWAGSRRKLKSSRRRCKVPKATWKSFLSLSLNNLSNLEEENDSKRESSTVETSVGARLSDCFSDLTDITAAATSADKALELREVALQQSVKNLLQRWGDARNGQAGAAPAGKPPVIPRTKAPTTDVPGEASASVFREARPQNPQSRLRRASLLCEALDLTVVVPTPPTPVPSSDPKVPGSGREHLNTPSPARQVRVAVDLNHQSLTLPAFYSLDAAKDDAQKTSRTRAGTGACPSPLVSRRNWMDSEADRVSEPVYPSTARAGTNRCHHHVDKKSLYPSIDRGGQLFKKPRKIRQVKPKRAEPNLIRSLLLIYVCAFVFYMPTVVTIVLTFVLKEDLPAEVNVASTLALFANCAVNWVLYGAMNTAYRKQYLSVLADIFHCCCSPFRRRLPSTATSLGPVTHRDHQ